MATASPPTSTNLSTSHAEQTIASASQQPKDAQALNGQPFYRALYDHTSAEASELSFRKNDIIDILGMDPSGWWDGLLGDKRGWVPSNYVVAVAGEPLSPVSAHDSSLGGGVGRVLVEAAHGVAGDVGREQVLPSSQPNIYVPLAYDDYDDDEKLADSSVPGEHHPFNSCSNADVEIGVHGAHTRLWNRRPVLVSLLFCLGLLCALLLICISLEIVPNWLDTLIQYLVFAVTRPIYIQHW